MTLSITLSPELEATLREKAAATGQTPDQYAAHVLERAIKQPSLDELLAPFRQQVADSGMNDEQLDDFFSGLREKAFDERQGRRG